MPNNSYTGAGATLSSNYYVRNFYISNRNAYTASSRKNIGSTELTLADSMALRRAVKNLGSSEFSETEDTNIRNSVLAYIQTYNNTLSSASASSDDTLEHNMRQLKSVTSKYSAELDKIGITINEDGTLASRDSLFTSAALSKFEALFSKDSEFMQQTSACAKRIERRSEALGLSAKNQTSKKTETAKATNTGSTAEASTAAAQLVSESMDLDTLLNTGVGQNVNIVL